MPQAEPGTSLASSRRVPMYERTAAALEAEIRSGKLGADERLLSERALAERLKVSRITIRRALAYLAEKDLVRSSDRSGWFAGPVSEGLDALISFTDMGRQRGFTVSSRVLPTRARFAIQAAACEPADAQHLEISRGEPVLIFTQTGYDQLGRAFELARTVYRADRYLFRGTLVAASEADAPVVQITPSPTDVVP